MAATHVCFVCVKYIYKVINSKMHLNTKSVNQLESECDESRGGVRMGTRAESNLEHI